MSFIVVSSALALLVAPGAALGLARRASARGWVRWSTASIVLGVLLLEVGLSLIALPTVLGSIGLAGFAELCSRIAGHVLLWGGALGWPAAVGAVVLASAVLSGFVRAVRTHRSMCAGAAYARPLGEIDGVAVVEVPASAPFALAVPGRPACVVVSSGALGALSDSELSAVIGHEVAHLHQKHWLGLALVAGTRRALGWLPPVRRSLQSVRLGIERAADESAAGPRGERRTAVKSAILKLAGIHLPAHALAFSDSDLIVERLRALDNGRRASLLVSGGVGIAVLAVTAVALATLGSWLGHVHEMTILAGLCPI